MKARELAIIIANIHSVSTALWQVVMLAPIVNGEKVITIVPSNVMSASEKLRECCTQLKQLIPDTEIEIEGGSDAGSLE